MLVADVRAVEGEPLRFRVRLGEGSGEALNFRARIHAGTAEAGSDYLDPDSPFVQVRFGQSGAVFEVPTLADEALEGDETVWLTLSPEHRTARRRLVFERPAAKGTVVDAQGPSLRIPLLPSPGGGSGREGFIRVFNGGAEAAPVEVSAVDDAGHGAGTLGVTVDPGAALGLSARDLEDGNAAKGVAEGIGPPGLGDWRLDLRADSAGVSAGGYMRLLGTGGPADGFVTSLHDWAPESLPDLPETAGAPVGALYQVPILNPGSNFNQVSLLRLVNVGAAPAEVSVGGVDDAGAPGAEAARLTIQGGASRTLTAAQLESGEGLSGALGDGSGKWRLVVSSDRPLLVQSLMETPGGLLANLSTAPQAEPDGDDEWAWQVPLFPSASDPSGRQGFVRVVNPTDEPGELTVQARDDSGLSHDPITLSVGPGATAAFNSNDLELGNEAKGLPAGVGSGEGDWRLTLRGGFEFRPRAYLRTQDGFLAGMHDLLPEAADGGGEGFAHAYHAAFFNPASNVNQVSSLRLLNDGGATARVSVTGTDDRGAASGEVRLTVPAEGVRTVTAAQLEAGAPGLSGALGDGAGKWRLLVRSDRPIRAMSLLESPAGHLTNLSTAPEGRD